MTGIFQNLLYGNKVTFLKIMVSHTVALPSELSEGNPAYFIN